MTTRAYEPLTAGNAALVLVDHQVGLMTGVRDISIGELNRRPEAGAVYGALNKPWATLVGQVADAMRK